MKKLIRGLHKFQAEVFPEQKKFFEQLAIGQTPEVLFITCSDSRINPNLITSTDPGDLFIIRNAGNIIPDTLSGGEWATIEFALFGLHIQHIIICGHSLCGAMQAALNENNNKIPVLQKWIDKNVEPTLTLIRENYPKLNDNELLNVLIQENVLHQVEQLKRHKKIDKLINERAITIHAWVYEFQTGDVFSYDAGDGQFKPIHHVE